MGTVHPIATKLSQYIPLVRFSRVVNLIIAADNILQKFPMPVNTSGPFVCICVLGNWKLFAYSLRSDNGRHTLYGSNNIFTIACACTTHVEVVTKMCSPIQATPLRWRHNDHDGVSNHQPYHCLLNRLFRRKSKKTSKLRVTGLCVGNSPGPVNSPHKGPVTWKMFPFDDVIMRDTLLKISESHP